MVIKVCMRLSFSQVWACNLGGNNPDTSKIVDRKKSKALKFVIV